MISLSNFKKYCEIGKQLIEKDVIAPRIINENSMRFKSDSKELKEILLKEEVDYGDFIEFLNRELNKIIIAILSDNIDFLKHFLIETSDDEDEEEDAENGNEILSEKIKLVEDILIDDQIRAAFLIKSTSKNKLISQITWEINEKTFDSYEGEIEKLKYATLVIKEIGSEAGLPFSAVFPFVNEDKEAKVYTLTKQDIDYLLKELTRLKDVLANE
ncbi:hypothetical protein [Brevibacillus sp. HB2.2]|uniref:hypothetical protein n=1 Tax=Brevibacillus sp. HB2.2 TaxID=2738846 RepID=UPI00156B5829|nr:hypothetical protein [Brevibacillus sp. HB2.2]NRS51758.1 hypothetical protein [Brevibacillus sp. HB2.2]